MLGGREPEVNRKRARDVIDRSRNVGRSGSERSAPLKRFLGKARTADTFEKALTTGFLGRPRQGRMDPCDGNRPFGTVRLVVS